LLAETKSDGERQAAEHARNRILQRLKDELDSTLIEEAVSFPSPWEKQLFVAICGKYQIHTYRYKRQKYTTVMFRANKGFFEKVLRPEYQKYSRLLRNLLSDIMSDLISKIHQGEEEIVLAGELCMD